MIGPISRSWCQVDITNWHRHVFHLQYISNVKAISRAMNVHWEDHFNYFYLKFSIWSHQPTITPIIKNVCPLLFLGIFAWESFCQILAKHLWQISFLVKSHAFSIFIWTPLDGCLWSMKIILWGRRILF